MGWQDAPIVEDETTPAWMSAPAVDSEPAPSSEQSGPTIARARAERLIPEPVSRPPREKPRYLQNTSVLEDIATGFDSGIKGFGYGVTQGALEGAQYLIPGKQKFLDEQIDRMRNAEALRRKEMKGLKDARGGAGLTNPVSIAEFAGEVAPWGALGGGEVASDLTSKLPVSYWKTAMSGLKTGTAAGYSQPLTKDESRLVSTGAGAVGGLALAPATRFVGDLAKYTYKAGKEAAVSRLERHALKKANPEAWAKLNNPAGDMIQRGLNRVAPLSPKARKSMRALGNTINDDQGAVKTISTLRDGMTFSRNGRIVEGELPKTLPEFLSATYQGIEKLQARAAQFSDAADAAGVKVGLRDTLKSLKTIIDSDGTTAEMKRTAMSLLKEYAPIAERGGLSVADAIARMQNLNLETQQLHAGANLSGKSLKVMGDLAHSLRTSLNNALDNPQAPQEFATIRKEMGQLIGLQERLLPMVVKEANKNSKVDVTLYDVIASEQFIRGAARGKPLTASMEATASYLTGKAFKHLNSYDRAVRRIFRASDYLTNSERRSFGAVPEFQAETPVFNPFPQGARSVLEDIGGNQ